MNFILKGYILIVEENMSFYDKVYEIVKQIPDGKVATYGQIAFLLGSPLLVYSL